MRSSAPSFLAAVALAAAPAAAVSQTPARPDTTSRQAAVQSAGADTVASTTLNPVRVLASRRSAYAASRTTTATKTATLLRDVPQSVTVVGRDLIRDAG